MARRGGFIIMMAGHKTSAGVAKVASKVLNRQAVVSQFAESPHRNFRSVRRENAAKSEIIGVALLSNSRQFQ